MAHELLPPSLRSRTDREPQLSEHSYGTSPTALEITGGKSLACGKFICGAQDCFWRVTPLVPDQVVGRGRSETVLLEERFGPKPVVILYCAHDLNSSHATPVHCHRVVLRVRQAEEWEHRHQVRVRSDALRSGLPVRHEDHSRGEYVVGEDPTVRVPGRHGAVKVKNVRQQRVGRGPGFVVRIAMLA